MFAITSGLIPEVSKPNILFILTDDQDLMLDSLMVMPNLQELIYDFGINFTNAFTTTPVCCPSRSSFLTGKYLHNTGVRNNSLQGNCSSSMWRQNQEPYTIPTYLSGYQRMFTGKYLNAYDGSYVPPGWDNFIGLVGNSVYYNYKMNENGVIINYGSNYDTDYLPNVMLNKTLEFINATQEPFFIYFSLPSPHQPADPPPQYSSLLNGTISPRIPSWNKLTPDKHWFVEYFSVMNDNVVAYSDLLYRRRLLTLMWVDQIIKTLVENINLSTTYVFFTSDNGYHLGEFALPLDKRQPYEFDIRIPLAVRVPNSNTGTIDNRFVLNIDILPTILDIAGIDIPTDIDGISIFSNQSRDEFLVEYHGEYGYYCSATPANMDCYTQQQYQTPPYFEGAFFCACQDARNNTYSCLRGIGYKYCEFDTSQLEYYDLDNDEFELNNTVGSLTYSEIESLHRQLQSLQECEGATCH